MDRHDVSLAAGVFSGVVVVAFDGCRGPTSGVFDASNREEDPDPALCGPVPVSSEVVLPVRYQL